MILLIDNFDSFAHNLARYFRRLGCQVVVARNDALDLAAAERLRPEAIVLSPGPCTPTQAGCSVALVERFWREVPILGVCLGHQAVGVAFGASIGRAVQPVHGMASYISHDGLGVFRDLPNPMQACRYHSLVVEAASLPPCLVPTAWTADRVLMAVRHRSRPVVGLQFHPESILTEQGYELLANFLTLAGLRRPKAIPRRSDELRESAPGETPLPGSPVTF